jgi:ubiquinone/menaquinone biosynthesis C-methylase UbiE
MLSAIQSPSSTSTITEGKAPIDYKVATAEDLSFIQSDSVDMVTAGQAAHWFKHEKSFPEIARILKPGGTLAYFCILLSNCARMVTDLCRLREFLDRGADGIDWIVTAVYLRRTRYIRSLLGGTRSKYRRLTLSRHCPPGSIIHGHHPPFLP